MAWRHWTPATFHDAHRDQTRQRKARAPGHRHALRNRPHRLGLRSHPDCRAAHARQRQSNTARQSINACQRQSTSASSTPPRHSHPDCRASLIQIVAPHNAQVAVLITLQEAKVLAHLLTAQVTELRLVVSPNELTGFTGSAEPYPASTD